MSNLKLSDVLHALAKKREAAKRQIEADAVVSRKILLDMAENLVPNQHNIRSVRNDAASAISIELHDTDASMLLGRWTEAPSGAIQYMPERHGKACTVDSAEAAIQATGEMVDSWVHDGHRQAAVEKARAERYEKMNRRHQSSY